MPLCGVLFPRDAHFEATLLGPRSQVRTLPCPGQCAHVPWGILWALTPEEAAHVQQLAPHHSGHQWRLLRVPRFMLQLSAQHKVASSITVALYMSCMCPQQSAGKERLEGGSPAPHPPGPGIHNASTLLCPQHNVAYTQRPSDSHHRSFCHFLLSISNTDK